LIHPDDDADADIVLAFDGDEIYDEKSGRRFLDYPVMRSWLEENIKALPYVEDQDGKRVSDIFIRHFKDRSIVVIDLSGKAKMLCLKRNGQKIFFMLEKNGISVFPGWKISLDQKNTLRADFEKEEFNFTLAEELNDLVLAVRNYGEIPELLLDDQKVELKKACDKLPQGITELYLESDKLNLTIGNHSLKLLNKIQDCAYLPLAIFIGAFAIQKENTLLNHGSFTNNLHGYSGKITQTARIEIPGNASAIRLETDDLCTELWINGTSCGKRLWAPFEWRLPVGIQGETTEVKIERLTSCGAIFGEKSFNISSTWSWLEEYKPNNSAPLYPCCEIIWK